MISEMVALVSAITRHVRLSTHDTPHVTFFTSGSAGQTSLYARYVRHIFYSAHAYFEQLPVTKVTACTYSI